MNNIYKNNVLLCFLKRNICATCRRIFLLTIESGDVNKHSDCILKKTLIRRIETIYAETFGGNSSWSLSSA